MDATARNKRETYTDDSSAEDWVGEEGRALAKRERLRKDSDDPIVRIISVVQRGGHRYTHLLIAVAEVVQME